MSAVLTLYLAVTRRLQITRQELPMSALSIHHMNTTNYLVCCHVIMLCYMTPHIAINNALMSPNERHSSRSTY